MKKFLSYIYKRICELSLKPDKTSYIWARRAPSALACIVLWTIWFLRHFSFYQAVKTIYRELGIRFKFGYVENASGRPDVPPMLGELYFLFFTVLFSVTHYLGINNIFLTALAYYFVFESSLWIIYYTVFRRFFEVGYTIYHQLEYILTIALLIPAQALCFARIYSMSVRDVFVSLLGAAEEDTPVILVIFGFFLGAIIIGIIISTFPTENIKKGIKKAKMLIVGCGDVVKSRLYPALVNSEYAITTVGYDIKGKENILPNCEQLESIDEIKTTVAKKADAGSIVWVETPPASHAEYAKLCINNKAGLVVVEKPIAVSAQDLSVFEELTASRQSRKKMFFLSYYVLEKALPLNYLVSIKNKNSKKVNFYKKYLETTSEALTVDWNDFLGELRSVSITVNEGKDTRDWVRDEAQGGQLFETFFHNIMIATLFCGPAAAIDNDGKVVELWKNVEFKNADYTKEVHEISLKANSGAVGIDLVMRKNAEARSRTAEFIFENGEITADFDAKTATISFTHLKAKCTVGFKDEYIQNYSTLVDMVGRVYSGEALAEEVDGFEHQLPTLRWLHTLRGANKQ